MRSTDDNRRSASRSRRRVAFSALLSVSAIVLAACSGSGPQSALEPEGQVARDLDGLWDLVFILATIVFVIVAIGMVVSIVRFRERKDDDREPKQLHGNTALEITWTIIPAVILAVISVPTVQGIFDLRSEPEGPRIDIDVVGHQWWWEFTYPDYLDANGQPITTANELHMPSGENVYLTMTSADVIHSFWVPPLNGKRDVVPGRESNLKLLADPGTENKQFADFLPPGVILGQCAEYCWLAHADMRIRVFVHSPADFDAWVAAQQQPAAVPDESQELLASGYDTFIGICTACHQATVSGPDGIEVLGPRLTIEGSGREFQSALAPNLTHFGSRTTFGSATFDSTPEHLAQWLANPSDLKPMDPDRNDIAAGRILGMPNLGLDQEDIAGLVALLESWE